MPNYTFALDASDPLAQYVRVTVGGETVAVLHISHAIHRGFNIRRLEKILGSFNLRELLFDHETVRIEVEEPLQFR